MKERKNNKKNGYGIFMMNDLDIMKGKWTEIKENEKDTHVKYGIKEGIFENDKYIYGNNRS